MNKNIELEQLKDIFEFERHFYSAFSDVHRGDGYRVYYRQGHPEITDCNHAYLDLSNNYYRKVDVIEQNIEEIEQFYSDLGRPARFYQGFYADEVELLKPILEERGYHFESFDDTQLYVLEPKLYETSKQLFDPRKDATIEEIIDPLYLDRRLFMDVDGHDGWYTILGELLSHHRLRVFVIREKNEAVALATANVKGDYCRIDQVRTVKSHRNMGYCFTLTRLMLDLLVSEGQASYFYLYASKPQAIIPYQKNGFKKQSIGSGIWGAWRD